MAKETQWRERVAEWRASGLSAERFCADKDYTAKSLWHWSSRFGRLRRSSSPSKRETRAVPVARLVRHNGASVCDDGTVVIEMHGARIEVRGAVKATTLQAVVEGLRAAHTEQVR